MTVHQLDFVFPFVVLAYGVIMTFVLGHPKLMELAEQRLHPEVFEQFRSKRALGFVCLVVGALWSLQNLVL